MNETTPEERFARCIYLIKKGNICFEDEARDLAKSPLQNAAICNVLITGANILYNDYLGLIREGQADYEPVARRLAERFKFSTRTLDSALSSGMEALERPTVTRMAREA